MDSAPSTSMDSPPKQFGPEGSYRLLHEIGHGACGRVFECRRDSSRYAVKAVSLRALRLRPTAIRDLKRAQGEIEILRQLPAHRRIVQMIDSFEEVGWFFLVLELVSGGTLAAALLSRPGPPPHFSDEETIFVFWQLVDGLQFLHSRSVIHRDLKLENVLVSESHPKDGNFLYNVKISDFGLSKALGPMEMQATSCVGSRRYVAPEVLRRGQAYDKSVDVWSLGVLTFVLRSGRFPTQNSLGDTQERIDQAVDELHTSADGRKILKELLQLDPVKRTTLEEVERSVWYSDDEDLTMSLPQGSTGQAEMMSGSQASQSLLEPDSMMEPSQCFIAPPAPFTEIGGPSDVQEPDPELEPYFSAPMAGVTESFWEGIQEAINASSVHQPLEEDEEEDAQEPASKRQRC